MLGRSYETQVCSAARALEVVGERWSLLIVRDAMFRGFTRFSDFERSLGVAPNILARRLETLVAAGVFEPRAPGTGPGEYVLTRKGLELKPVVVALTAWGDRWAAAPDGPPVVFEHEGCGGRVKQKLHCSRCDDVPKLADVVARSTSAPPAKRSG